MNNTLKNNIDRIRRAYWFCIAMIIRAFTKAEKDTVFCSSFAFKKYACNPKAITEFLLTNAPEMKIFWAFDKGIEIHGIDTRIKIVRRCTFSYLKALYSSRFVINNQRNDPFLTMFIKRKDQKYIMTWHSSMRLKKVEKDAEAVLGRHYVKNAIKDSQMCDLMISNSRLYTELIRNSFWYSGEILENCIPRNDCFYDKELIAESYKAVRNKLGLSENAKIVLYAPTFRRDIANLEPYRIQWNRVMPYLKELLGDDVHVLIRLHPNMTSCEGIDSLINFENVFNITKEPDITPFLFAADLLITDYTSAMFDALIINLPCMLYAIDRESYDRGFYLDFKQLPFSLAETTDDLIENIKSFSTSDYQRTTNEFKTKTWGLQEDGNGCNRLYQWMRQHSKH